MKKFHLSTPASIFILTLIFLLTTSFMLPLQNHVTSDDFAYARMVEHLNQTGEFKMSEWAAASTIFQTYWSLMFVKIFGYSIQILYLSNIVILYIGIIFFYFLLKRFNLGEFRSIIFSLALLSSPWIFQYTYTFMTETFYMTLLIISLYFYTKALQEHNNHLFLIASVFSGFAFLQRQIAIVLSFSIVIIFVYQYLTTRKFYRTTFISALAPTFVTVIAYSIWTKYVGATLGQARFTIEYVQQSVLPYLLPLNLNQIITTNRIYHNSLIERNIGYFINIAVMISPFFLIYKLKPKKIVTFFCNNLKLLMFTIIVILLAFIINYFQGSKYTRYPNFILNQSLNFLDREKLWTFLAIISLPLWIHIFVISLQKMYHSFFVPKNKPSTYLFKQISIIFLCISIFLFVLLYMAPLPEKFRYKPEFNDAPGLAFVKTVDDLPFSFRFPKAIKESWFVIITFLTFTISISYLLINKKLKKLENSQLILFFLGLVLLLQYLAILLLAYFFSLDYLIQLIPLIILLVAYIYKDVPVNHFKAVIVCCLILLFSLYTTRYRYQSDGIKWDTATKLVSQGVNPTNLEVTWAWPPYYFFESCIKEATKKYSNYKYRIPRDRIIQCASVYPHGELYKFTVLPEKNNLLLNKNEEIASSPQFFSVFWQTYKIVTIKEQRP